MLRSGRNVEHGFLRVIFIFNIMLYNPQSWCPRYFSLQLATVRRNIFKERNGEIICTHWPFSGPIEVRVACCILGASDVCCDNAGLFNMGTWCNIILMIRDTLRGTWYIRLTWTVIKDGKITVSLPACTSQGMLETGHLQSGRRCDVKKSRRSLPTRF